MAVRTILKMGDPQLLQVAKLVEKFNTPELHALIQDMKNTMSEYDGIGLAAPQIGISLQVMIFGVPESPRYPDMEPVPETILVNPKITMLDNKLEEDWEGCLSVPGMRGRVPRHVHIKYEGVDITGKRITRTASGWHARVVQHEYDHLHGILYPMRIKDMQYFGFSEALFPGEVLKDD